MCYNLIIKKKKDFWWFYMLKECKIIREKMCKINRQSLGYNTEQVFDKNIIFKFFFGGGVHFLNALIYNTNSNCIRRYNSVSTGVLQFVISSFYI